MADRSRRTASKPVAFPRVPWSRSAEVDRAIQAIVQRWVAPTLVVAFAGCGTSHGPIDDSPSARAGGSAPDVAGTQTPSGGAGGSADDPDPLAPFAPDLLAEGSGFLPLSCDASGWDPMAGVAPAQDFDYRALMAREELNGAMNVLSEQGAACSTATDAATCDVAWRLRPGYLEQNHCGQSGCTSHYVATTLGDTVEHWSTREELLEFLGPIDAPEDALLIVFYDGYDLGHAVGSDRCATAAVRAVDDGYEVFASRLTDDCAPIRTTRYLLHVTRDGAVTELRSATAAEDTACAGRRPEGLTDPTASAADALGAYLARSAHLEAASVHAFERMLDELQSHAAPVELIAAALQARDDEVRHAERVTRIAARFGAEAPPVQIEACAPRSLCAMAIENAVEGCVRETWGALLGTYQAAHAEDAELAAAMHEIAADERRHAALSWQLGAWLDAQLAEDDRSRVAAAYATAIAELREQASWPSHPSLVRTAGLPDGDTALALLDALEEFLLPPAGLDA